MDNKLIKMRMIKMMEMGMNNKAKAKTFQDILRTT